MQLIQPIQHYCDSCKSTEATYHVTLTADVFGGSTTNVNRRKVVQFWLCSACEMQSRDNLARDHMQKGRVARLLSSELSNSEYPDWYRDSEKMYVSE